MVGLILTMLIKCVFSNVVLDAFLIENVSK